MRPRHVPLAVFASLATDQLCQLVTARARSGGARIALFAHVAHSVGACVSKGAFECVQAACMSVLCGLILLTTQSDAKGAVASRRVFDAHLVVCSVAFCAVSCALAGNRAVLRHDVKSVRHASTVCALFACACILVRAMRYAMPFCYAVSIATLPLFVVHVRGPGARPTTVARIRRRMAIVCAMDAAAFVLDALQRCMYAVQHGIHTWYSSCAELCAIAVAAYVAMVAIPQLALLRWRGRTFHANAWRRTELYLAIGASALLARSRQTLLMAALNLLVLVATAVTSANATRAARNIL